MKSIYFIIFCFFYTLLGNCQELQFTTLNYQQVENKVVIFYKIENVSKDTFLLAKKFLILNFMFENCVECSRNIKRTGDMALYPIILFSDSLFRFKSNREFCKNYIDSNDFPMIIPNTTVYMSAKCDFILQGAFPKKTYELTSYFSISEELKEYCSRIWTGHVKTCSTISVK